LLAAQYSFGLLPLIRSGGKVHRIGLIFTPVKALEMAGQDPENPAVRMFVHTLRELGYVEGSNLALERRCAEGKYGRFSEIVRKLVSLNADVIVTITNPMTKSGKGGDAHNPYGHGCQRRSRRKRTGPEPGSATWKRYRPQPRYGSRYRCEASSLKRSFP
jgi:hypothetical protein